MNLTVEAKTTLTPETPFACSLLAPMTEMQQSGLLTHIATTESGSLLVLMKG